MRVIIISVYNRRCIRTIYIIPFAPKREHASDSLFAVVFLNLTFGRVVVKRKMADV